MVRRYGDLVQEIHERQRFTLAEWTRKIIDALLFSLEQMEGQDEHERQEDMISYEQWRDWQENIAKRFGLSETTDTPVDKSLRNRGPKKITTSEELFAR